MMKKLIANIVGLFLLMTSLIACTEESTFDSDVHEVGTITLGLNYKMLSRAAEEAGDDLYNENKIEKVDIFFYKENNLNTCVFYPENVKLNNGAGTVTVKVPQGQLGLFEGGIYSVYVIANGGFSRNELANKSVDELKAMSFTTDFLLDNGTPASFLMDGLSSGITLTKDGTSGQVDLYRAASKIVLTATVQDEIVGEDGTHYTPLMDGMYVSLYNGVKKTNVNTADKPYTVSAEDYFSTPDRAIKEKRNIGEDEKSGHVPFYSYATSWDENDNHETYLLLTVPWKVKSEEGESYTRYYYRVPINNQYKNLVRNNLYRINLSVAILGSTQKEDAVELNPNYLILNWSTEEIDTDLEDFKYLVLDENFKVMNNTPTCKIGYASSSEITVNVTKVILPDYSIEDFDKDREITFNSADYKTSFDANEITFSHSLTEEDFAPYTITLVVTNNDSYSETVVITQYPKIYIDGERNTGTNNKGYVYVNNNTDSNSSWNTVRGLEGKNKNPNMYVINVTAFYNEDNYMIGDSRGDKTPSAEENTPLGYNQWADGADYWNNQISRKILAYYPSKDNDTSISEVMIAPQFRIASSYGVVGGAIKYDAAKRRCASYQEFGYPAGRWRVPTIAEFKFISSLSARKKIPLLFNNGSGYWVAGAKCTPQSNNTTTPVKVDKSTSGEAFVRCVYDEWYWGNKQIANKAKFTWGDKER